ncbi:hypothetical protein KCP69_12155 [Salmonella enterica subsp. enterica]|nr:hypothetical protein KCP69_12155 [Salmonella enterica subsp. enterica]
MLAVGDRRLLCALAICKVGIQPAAVENRRSAHSRATTLCAEWRNRSAPDVTHPAVKSHQSDIGISCGASRRQ